MRPLAQRNLPNNHIFYIRCPLPHNLYRTSQENVMNLKKIYWLQCGEEEMYLFERETVTREILRSNWRIIMIITNELQNDKCLKCSESKGTLILACENDTSHMIHVGCLSLALYRSPSNGKYPSLTLNPEYQLFIESPAAVFVYACKNGMASLAVDVLKQHDLPKNVIGAGFACATYGDRMGTVQMLFNNYFQSRECATTCLTIAIQQKKLKLVKLWYRLCSEKDMEFEKKIISEDQSNELFNFLKGKIDMSFSTLCLGKALRSGNTTLAQTIVRSYKRKTLWQIFKYRWLDRASRKSVYLKTCEACLWGDLATLRIMEEEGFYVHISGDLALISAHFMGHSEIKLFLKSRGCKLDTKSLFYKLAEACAANSMVQLKKLISKWKLMASYTLEDFILKLMLILLIRNGNLLMIEFILSKCSFLSTGTGGAFEYAVDLRKMQIVHVFLEKFNILTYYAVARGCYYNDDLFIKGIVPFLQKDHRQAAFSKIYAYGMIHHNFEMIRLSENSAEFKDMLKPL